MDVAQTYEGRERYRINVRYPRELRDNIEALGNVLVRIAPLSPRPLPVGRVQSGSNMAAPNASMGGGMGTRSQAAAGPSKGGGMSSAARRPLALA